LPSIRPGEIAATSGSVNDPAPAGETPGHGIGTAPLPKWNDQKTAEKYYERNILLRTTQYSTKSSLRGSLNRSNIPVNGNAGWKQE